MTPPPPQAAAPPTPEEMRAARELLEYFLLFSPDADLLPKSRRLIEATIAAALHAAEGRCREALSMQAAQRAVCSEIQQIMATYREQEAERGYVDTPGGLEHMGDVWRLLAQWDDNLRAAAILAQTTGERSTR
jgi:hypothetical protein